MTRKPDHRVGFEVQGKKRRLVLEIDDLTLALVVSVYTNGESLFGKRLIKAILNAENASENLLLSLEYSGVTFPNGPGKSSLSERQKKAAQEARAVWLR